MRLLSTSIGAAAIGLACLSLSVPAANAGRVGGPLSQTVIVRGNQIADFSFNFVAGEPAVITVSGNGVSNLELLIYDADGHVTIGDGRFDRKTARVDVYRTGTFRVEIRNLGPVDNTVTLVTN